MKKNHLISVLVMVALGLSIVSQVSCQNPPKFVFEGQIRNMSESKIILNRLLGHKETNVSEVQSKSDGSFRITLDEMPQIGQYRLRIDPAGRNNILEFLFAGEDRIRFTTDYGFLMDSMRFDNSEVNTLWYAYFKAKEDFETRLSILEHLLNIYPVDERFYPEVIKEFNLLQDELEQKIKEFLAGSSNQLLAAYIRSDQSPRINPYLSSEERQQFIRLNFLAKVDFSDTLLLRTDIFPGKALSFIMLFRNQRYEREQQAEEFIKATDQLLPLAMIQPVVYNYLLEYTISGFEQIGLEEVLLHIAENYPVDETCISDQDSGELERRMLGYKLLAPGNPAPEIKQNDIYENPFELSKLNSERILIFFWASWCPHCTAMMPDIKALATQLNADGIDQSDSQKLQVVSISIDHDKDEFQAYLENNNLNDSSLRAFWTNLCDYKAWDGQAATDFYLYATPTMILLNKDKQIIGKPSNVQELIKQLGI
ncbi:MAG: TlpA family protein disulfide reductase [Bacteroidales bacterium]|nr:TlpA family protein disulfide reductase [Bacteroidales bacterium]